MELLRETVGHIAPPLTCIPKQDTDKVGRGAICLEGDMEIIRNRIRSTIPRHTHNWRDYERGKAIIQAFDVLPEDYVKLVTWLAGWVGV